MNKFKFNSNGFIVILLDVESGDRISFFVDCLTWSDAVRYASDMLKLKKYKNCGIYSITRTVSHA